MKNHAKIWEGRKLAIGALTLAAFCGGAHAATVAYWPLAYANGVRMTESSQIESIGSSSGLAAVPICLDGTSADEVPAGYDYFPVGTNAFPAGYGVYDHVAASNLNAATGLYLKTGNGASGYAHGALKVGNSSGSLSLATFTVECFVRRQAETPRNNSWNAIAVVPRILYDNGTKVNNRDTWGLRITSFQANAVVRARFSNPDQSSSVQFSATCNGLGDFNWHHLALTVDDSTHTAKLYYDYELVGSMDLGFSLTYGQEDLYIGATPQTTSPFGGSLAHFRISDTALLPDQFLQFARVTASPHESNDVLLHINFDKVDGIPHNRNIVFNDAAKGVVQRVVTDSFPTLAEDGLPSSETRASLIASDAATNSGCMANVYAKQSTSYYTWLPAKDIFTNSSFTVECFYKTTESQGYRSLVWRRATSGAQFALNMNAANLRTVVGSGAVQDSSASNDGDWHHAAVVCDRSRGKVMLFRDYRFVDEASISSVNLASDAIPVCIGGLDGTASMRASLGGCIDDVRITMRALTPGEFLTSDYFDPTANTLAWVSFDGSLDSSVSPFALSNCVAEAGSGGDVPSRIDICSGDRVSVIDGRGRLLRRGNLQELLCRTGIVTYASNRLLPLFPNQTIEFFVKADAGQARNAGLLRCNAAFDATIPSWAMSFDSADRLKLRCAFLKDDGTLDSLNEINGTTGVEIADGRRHHVAMTLSQALENGEYSTIVSIYKDYGATPAWTKTVAGRLYYSGDSSVWLGGNTLACIDGIVDELRISNGVLAPEDFIRSELRGLTIIIR